MSFPAGGYLTNQEVAPETMVSMRSELVQAAPVTSTLMARLLGIQTGHWERFAAGHSHPSSEQVSPTIPEMSSISWTLLTPVSSGDSAGPTVAEAIYRILLTFNTV